MIIFNSFIDKNQLNLAGNLKNLPLNTVACIKLSPEKHTAFKDLIIKSLNNKRSHLPQKNQVWEKDENQYFGPSL